MNNRQLTKLYKFACSLFTIEKRCVYNTYNLKKPESL